jgi:hypothetical protein
MAEFVELMAEDAGYPFILVPSHPGIPYRIWPSGSSTSPCRHRHRVWRGSYGVGVPVDGVSSAAANSCESSKVSLATSGRSMAFEFVSAAKHVYVELMSSQRLNRAARFIIRTIGTGWPRDIAFTDVM